MAEVKDFFTHISAELNGVPAPVAVPALVELLVVAINCLPLSERKLATETTMAVLNEHVNLVSAGDVRMVHAI